jgi:hypothetical protein
MDLVSCLGLYARLQAALQILLLLGLSFRSRYFKPAPSFINISWIIHLESFGVAALLTLRRRTACLSDSFLIPSSAILQIFHVVCLNYTVCQGY